MNSLVKNLPRFWTRPLGLSCAIATAALFLAGCGAETPASAKTPGPAIKPPAALSSDRKSSNAVQVAKSTFHVDPKFGRDPFFPGSQQDLAKGNDAPVLTRQPLLSYLKLVGIRSGTTRPMALINRSPIAQGEEREVSIVVTNRASQPEVQKVSVRCVEVRRDSVLISIGGEQGFKELRMPQAK